MKFLKRALRNPSTVILANAGSQSMIRFVSNVMLARMLMPTAFALTSITMLIMTGIQMVSDVGIAVMTLRHGPMERSEQARMWTMQLLRGVGLSITVLLLAAPAAAIYETPELFYVLAALSIAPTIQGMQSLFPILALARQNLMPTFWVDVVGRIIGTALSIAFAFAYPTVWALVIGILAQMAISTVISHWIGGEGWPTFSLDWTFVRSHWRFSRWIQLGSSLTFVASQIDKAVFPLLFGIARFGVYGIGANFALIPAQITQRWSTSIFYPLIVQNLNGDDAARSRLMSTRVTMLLYSAAIVFGVIAISPSFFYILYKPSYREAARFAILIAAASYFEVAESSLKHFPLIDRTARYEFIIALVRIAAFAVFIVVIWLFHGSAELYALAFTSAQAISYLVILIICRNLKYTKINLDIIISGVVSLIVVVSYAIPRIPTSLGFAWLEAIGVSFLTVGVIFLIYRRRGLPSLPRAVPLSLLTQTAQAEELVAG